MLSLCLRRLAEVPSKSCFVPGRSVVSIAYRRQRKVSSQPYNSALGLFAVIFAVVPCVYVGGKLTKNLAGFLEEWNIFCYDEDDEDD